MRTKSLYHFPKEISCPAGTYHCSTGGEQGSTEVVRGNDSKPELIEGSVKIDQKIDNDKIVPMQNFKPMMGLGVMPFAA